MDVCENDDVQAQIIALPSLVQRHGCRSEDVQTISVSSRSGISVAETENIFLKSVSTIDLSSLPRCAKHIRLTSFRALTNTLF